MCDHEQLTNLYTRIYRHIWWFLFHHNFKKLGKNSCIYSPLKIQGAKYIEIEDHVSIYNKTWLLAFKIDENSPRIYIEKGTRIGHFSTISSMRNVHIGKNVLTADNIYITDSEHVYLDISVPIIKQPIKFKGNVSIGDNSWLGKNVCILGVKIGKHCIIGSNSVVTKDIPDYSVAVGTPAKVIKQYDFKTKDWKKI